MATITIKGKTITLRDDQVEDIVVCSLRTIEVGHCRDRDDEIELALAELEESLSSYGVTGEGW